jgi:glycosyltransferase involved in cell wall biosynthesis
MSERRATLSVAIITFNEQENIRRTLESVREIADEIVVVDSHSTDRTVEIAKEFGAKVFIEDWKGFAAQKNSALDKCTCDWILSLDADEEVSPELAIAVRVIAKGPELAQLIRANSKDSLERVEAVMAMEEVVDADLEDDLRPTSPAKFYSVRRQNLFLGKVMWSGGMYPDRKVRLFERGASKFAERSVHEDLIVRGRVATLNGDLIHHTYPTLTSYIEHMNRYSSLGAEMVVEKRKRAGFSVLNIVIRPIATFIYNYFFRLGFLDGKEGLLLHLYHSVYVSWKYAKAWEMSRQRKN